MHHSPGTFLKDLQEPVEEQCKSQQGHNMTYQSHGDDGLPQVPLVMLVGVDQIDEGDCHDTKYKVDHEEEEPIELIAESVLRAHL